MTGSQKGLYLECIAHPESTIYNLPFLGHIHEEVDPERLKNAVLKAVAAHPALNAVLMEEKDGTVVLKPAGTPPEVPVYTLSDEAFAERKKSLVRPFDLNGGKLARFEIYVTPSETCLFEDVHHLVFDGTSGRTLEKDVRRAMDGEEPEEERVSPFALAELEEAWLRSGEADGALAYWKELLTGCEPDCLPERDRWEETRSQG